MELFFLSAWSAVNGKVPRSTSLSTKLKDKEYANAFAEPEDNVIDPNAADPRF
jgi:hypothetical protein